MSENYREDFVSIKILFFAKARELSGTGSATFLIKRQILASELANEICHSFNLHSLRHSFIIAINEIYCEDLTESLELNSGDEIAIIPPISGG
ncbi:molybdopterin synthase sulfur carrier subunit [Anastrepha ludens]|uniref:molybdopterin synthase sulfur carrier subunit n=1 Tax=Anastrepha ludens TaxID=28586 RepID=UPI0023AF18BE|nr:molybdopterin synthase sulfur carrier subunit [Anastrepha ludens]